MCALTNIPKEKVLEIVKQGPTFPTKIAKALGADSMLVGAILSTLISTGSVRVSTLKIGGSPLYYIPEQESKLEDFIDHLGDKDQKTFHLLKEKKVLIDTEQDPLIRVSLRAIKDFAKSFEIEFDGKLIPCWRFYNISKDEAKIIAEDVVKASLKPLAAQSLPIVGDHAHAHEVPEAQHEVLHTHIHTHKKHEETTPIVEKKVVEKHVVIPVQAVASVNSEEDEASDVESLEKASKKISPKADFLAEVKKHIVSKNLDIISTQKIKKTEYDFVLKNHNSNEYIYCKSKDKKTIGEGDLAPAMIFAQNKKMPCMFFSTGNLTKKTVAMMNNEFSQITFEKIN